MVGCEGASFSEDIFAGFSGYIPNSLNPLTRLTGVNACGQASPTSRLMSYIYGNDLPWITAKVFPACFVEVGL